MPKGGKQPGAGRPAGSKNKLPRDIKDRVLAVWSRLEDEGKGLYDEAEKEPQWFYTNFVKPMLPKDVKIDGDLGMNIEITVLPVRPMHETPDTDT